MDLSELRKFLESKGVPCKDCVQKEDFVELAISVMNQSDVENSKPSSETFTNDIQLDEVISTLDKKETEPSHNGKSKSEFSDLITSYYEKFLEQYDNYLSIYGPKVKTFVKEQYSLFSINASKLLDQTVDFVETSVWPQAKEYSEKIYKKISGK